VDVEEQALRRRLAALRAEIMDAEQRAAALAEAETVLQTMRREVLSDKLSFERKRQIVRALARVTVQPGSEGRPEVHIHYRFAAPTYRWETRSAKANDVDVCEGRVFCEV
jgi:hypothetical protein